MYHKNLIVPGSQVIFTNSEHKIIAGTWGFGKPLMYNAKIENLRSTWKGYMNNRGVLELDGFYEKDFYFSRVDGSPLLIPIIYDRFFDFLVMTRPAKAPVISVHQRQPCMIKPGNADSWLDETKIIQMEDQDLQKTKAA